MDFINRMVVKLREHEDEALFLQEFYGFCFRVGIKVPAPIELRVKQRAICGEVFRDNCALLHTMSIRRMNEEQKRTNAQVLEERRIAYEEGRVFEWQESKDPETHKVVERRLVQAQRS